MPSKIITKSVVQINRELGILVVVLVLVIVHVLIVLVFVEIVVIFKDFIFVEVVVFVRIKRRSFFEIDRFDNRFDDNFLLVFHLFVKRFIDK